MASSVGTGNYLHRFGNTPQTQTIISSRNKIMAPNAGGGVDQVGLVSKFDIQESRDVAEVAGVGFGDIISELVPNRQKAVTIGVTRTAMYIQNIYQAFGYKAGIDGFIKALRHHRWPFDIRQEIVLSDVVKAAQAAKLGGSSSGAASTIANGPFGGMSVGRKAIVTNFEGCWMTSHNMSFTVDNSVVSEDVNISVTDMYDYARAAATSAEPTAVSGTMGGLATSNLFSGFNIPTTG